MISPTEVLIVDCEGRGKLKFELAKYDDYWVSLELDGVSGRALSGNYPGGDGLPQYFRELSADWKGWKGTRSWESPVHGFSLRADHNGHSRVALEVEFGPYAVHDGWRLKATIYVAPGELQGIAAELDDMFDARRKPHTA